MARTLFKRQRINPVVEGSGDIPEHWPMRPFSRSAVVCKDHGVITRLLHHFYDPFPTVEHFSLVARH